LDDLHKVILLHEKAMEVLSDNNSDLPMWLNNLGVALKDQYLKQENLENLSQIISLGERAVKLLQRIVQV